MDSKCLTKKIILRHSKRKTGPKEEKYLNILLSCKYNIILISYIIGKDFFYSEEGIILPFHRSSCRTGLPQGREALGDGKAFLLILVEAPFFTLTNGYAWGQELLDNRCEFKLQRWPGKEKDV